MADEVGAWAWYDSMHVVGVEGLVIKASNSTYQATRGWLKLKSVGGQGTVSRILVEEE